MILTLDKFFFKYEGRGVKLTPPPQKKLSSKSPTLLGLKWLFRPTFKRKKQLHNEVIAIKKE